MDEEKIEAVKKELNEKEMNALISEKIKKANLKEKQCSGGRAKWIAERSVAMCITHCIMEKNDMNFGEAIKLAWQFIREERCKPCSIE